MEAKEKALQMCKDEDAVLYANRGYVLPDGVGRLYEGIEMRKSGGEWYAADDLELELSKSMATFNGPADDPEEIAEAQELAKSLGEEERVLFLNKGRGLPPGTTRDWKGYKYRKEGDGTWKRVKGDGKAPETKGEAGDRKMKEGYAGDSEFKGVKVYDNGGKTADRYTVVIGKDAYSMSENAHAPNGVNMYAGEVGTDITLGGHLGKRVSQIPDAIKGAIKQRMGEADGGSDSGVRKQVGNFLVVESSNKKSWSVSDANGEGRTVSKDQAKTPEEAVKVIQGGADAKNTVQMSTLHSADSKAFDITKAESGGEIRGDKAKAKQYVNAVLDSMSKQGVTELSQEHYSKLEDDNYHLLNETLSLAGLYGKEKQDRAVASSKEKKEYLAEAVSERQGADKEGKLSDLKAQVQELDVKRNHSKSEKNKAELWKQGRDLVVQHDTLKYGKPRHEMTQKEHWDAMDNDSKTHNGGKYKDAMGREQTYKGEAHETSSYDPIHMYAVKHALEEGRKVPDEVLKDYPDLKKQFVDKKGK